MKSIKTFILQFQTKLLYRRFLKTISKIDDIISRNEIKQMIRSEFENQRHLSDEESIRFYMTKGEEQLKYIEQRFCQVI